MHGIDGNRIGLPYRIEKYEDFANRPWNGRVHSHMAITQKQKEDA
jgi:hypothetical protein